jgi:hypothetical protein
MIRLSLELLSDLLKEVLKVYFRQYDNATCVFPTVTSLINASFLPWLGKPRGTHQNIMAGLPGTKNIEQFHTS